MKQHHDYTLTNGTAPLFLQRSALTRHQLYPNNMVDLPTCNNMVDLPTLLLLFLSFVGGQKTTHKRKEFAYLRFVLLWLNFGYHIPVHGGTKIKNLIPRKP